tara:strand:+ start:472 stop:969 length:498 start_codon:yes stop_codon:yes gene_type:complete
LDIIPAIIPVDLDTGANTGDYVNLANAAGVLVVFYKGAGTAGQDPILVVHQATDKTGTGLKDLAAVRRVFLKQHAGLLAAGSTWSETTADAVPGATYTMNATAAEEQGLVAFYIDASLMDVANGFDWMNLTIADVGGNPQLGGALYILVGLSYPSAPAQLGSAVS